MAAVLQQKEVAHGMTSVFLGVTLMISANTSSMQLLPLLFASSVQQGLFKRQARIVCRGLDLETVLYCKTDQCADTENWQGVWDKLGFCICWTP